MDNNTVRFASVIGIALLSVGCAGLFQNKGEVFIREGGGHILSKGPPFSEIAGEHGPFAWMSLAAYERDIDCPDRECRSKPSACPEEPDTLLTDRGWIRWKEIPRLDEQGTELGKLMHERHLRVEVWSNEKVNQIVVAFGGTANLDDWKSNTRWFRDSKERKSDQYTLVTDQFMATFIATFEARKTAPDGKWMATAVLYSTGHSLGGGLAQQFAYALPDDPDVPRVTKVYAFDPSPVSGKRSVAWDRNAVGLHIFRIYNRGEALAAVRLAENFYEFPSSSNPKVTDFRYQVDWNPFFAIVPVNAVHWHGMQALACEMKVRGRI